MTLLQGDSGGPLTVEADGTHTLVGIVSRKLDYVCENPGYDIYTSVAALLTWIKTTIKENGGMASCGFTISGSPTLGIIDQKLSGQHADFHIFLTHQTVSLRKTDTTGK